MIKHKLVVEFDSAEEAERFKDAARRDAVFTYERSDSEFTSRHFVEFVDLVVTDHKPQAVKNSITGDNSGNSIQCRDIHGGVSFP